MSTQSEEVKCLSTTDTTLRPQHCSTIKTTAERIARRYQIDFLDKAKEGNIIACLETGCGKTLIAILLLKAFLNLFSIPQQSVSVFLVPTVNLVHQQGNMIECFSNLKVGQYAGHSDKDRWNQQKWEEDTCNFEVLVMTPQILLNILRHSLIKLETIKVLIFDECHHCQKEHPYAQIMEEFYFASDKAVRPRVFGMTASPIIRKGKSELQLVKDIASLEHLLDSKICSVKELTEIEALVPSPKIECKEYDHTYNSYDILQSHADMLHSLRIKHLRQILGRYSSEAKIDLWKQNQKFLIKICRDLEYCIFELGLWCARRAVENFLSVDGGNVGPTPEKSSEETPELDKELFLQEIFERISQMIPKGVEDLIVGSLMPDLVSNKVALLVDVLSNFRSSELKCIVFVERVIAAKVLASLLCHCFKDLRCKYIVGSHARMSNASRSMMRQTLLDFRSGVLNLLVATNVAEEGLDIQDCCLVIQFDLPKTLRSFIQARGRARSPGSYYVILKERGNLNDEELLASLAESEGLMKEQILHGGAVPLKLNDWEQQQKLETFKVKSTGATANLNYSVELLHHFCSKLPGDKFYQPTPEFSYISEAEGIKCQIILPSNSPIRIVVGEIRDNKRLAKKVACLKAIRSLHSIGSLTDYLLPQIGMMDAEKNVHNHKHATKETSAGCYAVLQEAIIPSVFFRQIICNSSMLCLQAYKLGFIAVPNDRKYTNFALFIQSPLSKDAANVSVNLQLARGRTVSCDLVSSGEVLFDEFQVTQSEKFQFVLFSILLDRDLACPNFERCVTYGGWYHLLPLMSTEDVRNSQGLQIDWNTINKVIQNNDNLISGHKTSAVCSSSTGSLYFADGLVDAREVPGSLIETVYSSNFYCVLEIIADLNGNSSFPDPLYESYADYFSSSRGVEISHKEQPLLRVTPLRYAHNLLVERNSKKTGAEASEQMLLELPPEVCRIKIYGLYDGLINAAALLPSFMHRLESILIAGELRDILTARFSEGYQVSVSKVLEALTTEKCMEQFSLERLELLGDSFLKYAVSCHLFHAHDKADEGFLSSQRIHRISNASLYVIGKRHGLSGYIRDTFFRPEHWVAPFHPSKFICDESNLVNLHGEASEDNNTEGKFSVICNKGHRWMQKKTVADVVEALIGAYLVDSGHTAALAFMECIGLKVSINPAKISSICLSSERNLSISTNFDGEAVEKLLSYHFRHKGLLIEAFTHASFNKHLGGCYQRLEFLGDSVLDYLITRYLYEKFNGLKPGQLTDLRSATVSNQNFARVAVQNNLYFHLIGNSTDLSQHIKKFVSDICKSRNLKSQIPGNWDGKKCPKVLGDLVESLAGAVFVDSEFDLDIVWNVFHPILQPIVTIESPVLHPVRELQELCQRNRLNLKFIPSKQNCSGFDIEIEVQVKHAVIVGSATAKDKKSAKRQAAHHALCQLKKLGYAHSQKSFIVYLDSSKSNKVDPVEENTSAFLDEVHAAQDKFILEENLFGYNAFSRQRSPSMLFHTADPKLSDSLHSSSGIETNLEREEDTILCNLCDSKSKSLCCEEKIIAENEETGIESLPCSIEIEVIDDIPASTPLPDIPFRNLIALSSDKLRYHEQPRMQRHGGQFTVLNPNHRNEPAESDAINLCSRQMKFNNSSSESKSMAAILTHNGHSKWQRQGRATDLEKLLHQFSFLQPKSTLQSAEPWVIDPHIRKMRSDSLETKSVTSASTNAGNCEELIWQEHSETNELERLLHQFALSKPKKTMESRHAHAVDFANRNMKSDSSSSEITVENLAIHNASSVEVLNKKRMTALRPDQGITGEILAECMESRILTVTSSKEHREASEFSLNGSPNPHTELTSESSKGTARSMLYEACARNGWKDPVFVSCKEDGMPHHRMFTFDVLVQVAEWHLTCSGEPRKSKKAAMDSAAEELLRCLKSQGYI